MSVLILFLLAAHCSANEESLLLRGLDTDTKDSHSDIEHNSANRYASFSTDLTGKIQPVALFSSQFEEVNQVDMNVIEGKVPDWLNGTLYRVGSGLYQLGKRKVTNLVDGLSKVHGWSFTPGQKPKYTTKFLRSRAYNETIKRGELPPMQVMDQLVPPLTWLETFEVLADLMEHGSADNNNVAVWELSKRGITVTTESPLYIDVDRNTLEFIEEYHILPKDFGYFEKELVSAAHFSRHYPSGDSINYKYIMGVKTGYYVVRYSSDESGKLIASTIGHVPVAMSDMRIVHSFGVTDNYAVFSRFNLVFSMKSMTKICDNINIDLSRSAVFDVVSLSDGKHTPFSFPAAEAMHLLNSFERYNENNELEIIIDWPTKNNVTEYPRKCIFKLLDIENIKNETYSYKKNWKAFGDVRLRRFILNMDTGKQTVQEFPQMWFPKFLQVEFPYINDNFRGRPYCFVYFQAWQYDVLNSMGLMKVDMCKQTSIGWEEINKFPVEPVFAPRPGSTIEDDGVIIAPVFDSATNTTETYIWNATDLSVLVRVDNPIVVPYTLHGLWVAK